MTDEEEPIEYSSWVVESKFAPSRSNIDLVDRGRLINRLEAARQCKVIIVNAPAGFGKSTILCQWYEAHDKNEDIFSWLSLDEGDAEPRQFLSYVVLSMAKGGADLGPLEVAARNGLADSNPELVTNSLMNRIAELPENCLLILDDFHIATSDATDRLIEQMVRQAPGNFTLVINSRTPPPLDVPILVAAGDAHEIGPEQLRLTQEEAISALGDKISLPDAKEIFEQTEGWPVAVQLARVQKQVQPSVQIQSGVSTGLIASYLTDQVIDTIETDLRDFLLKVSVLEQFNAALADAVTGRTDSWHMLRRLEPLSALIIPTDSAAGWVRLHHLFAEYLRKTLKAQAPGSIAGLQMAASRWFDTDGQIIPAVKYASAAGNDDEAERLILDAGGWSVILTEGIYVMRALLNILPDHLVSRSARLMLARAYLCCKDGDCQQARGLLDASKNLRSNHQADAYDRDRRLVGAMVSTYEDAPGWAERVAASDFADEADRWTPLEAGTLLSEAIVASFSVGELGQVHDNIEATFGEMRRSGSVLGLNYTYIHAAILALYLAKFELSKANISQALELAENNFGSDSGLKHLSMMMEFSLRIWSGEAGQADIEALSQTLSYIEQYDGWAEAYLIGLDAAFHLCEQHGELGHAADLCDRFHTLAMNRSLERLERLCTIFQMRLAYLRGHSTDAKALGTDLAEWVFEHQLQKGARDWQNHYLAASSLASSRMLPPAHAINMLRTCIDDCERRDAGLFRIRLLVTEAFLFWQLEKRDESIASLTRALTLAAPQKIIGPFLYDDRLNRVLVATKNGLSHKQENLILVNFVTDILKRRQEFRPGSGNEKLSSREQDIIEQVAEGRSNKEIARRFELTENTVKFHLKNIYAKLSVNRRIQAVAVARDLKLID